MAGLHFEVTADNNDFLRKMQGVRSAVANASSGVEKEGERMDAAFKRLAASVGAIFTAQQAARIIENIVRVRGEFQQLEVAFTTMLRSGEKADKLMAEAVDFAAHTPFDLQGVASGIRQLLAYGTAAEDAIKEVEMLGNVAAGLSVPLNDMIYLYGTLRSQGRAYTVDIRQFAGRGVPIYEELSKVLGVTVEQVNEFITAGKVGFAEVEQAFKNMTSEGGMFYNLMQEQSKTITGQISNLKDNIDMMFNEMGQNAEGFISDVISGASYLVEHYKDVLRILGSLVAMYGSYRATLMLVAATQKSSVALGNARMTIMKLEAVLSGQVVAQEKAMVLARETHVAALQKELTAEEQANIVKRLRVSAIQQLLTAQQQEYLSNLNLTASSANYEAVAMSVLTVEQKEALGKTDLSAKSALYRSALEQEVLAKRQSMAATLEAMRAEVKAAAQKLASSKQSTASSRQVVAAAQAELAAATQVGNASRIVTAQKRLESAQDSLLAAKKSQLAAMSDFYAKKKLLESTASRQAAVASAADTAAKEAQAAATTLVGTASSRTSRFVKSLTTAIKANPIGLAISAITGLIAAISSWVSKQREAREEIEAAVKPLQDEYRQVNELTNKLKDSNLKEEERKKVLTELKELAPDVVAGIEDEADSLEVLNDRLEDFNNEKLAEIAVKRFSMEGGFEETVTELDEAKGKLEQEAAGLYDVYSTLYSRFAELDPKLREATNLQYIFDSNKDIPEKVRQLFNNFELYGEYINGEIFGDETKSRLSGYRTVFTGLDIDDYDKALAKFEKREDEYAEHAEELKSKIRSIAESMYPDDSTRRDSFLSRTLAAYGLGGDSGTTEPIGPQPRLLPKDFDSQVEAAKRAVEEAGKELSDLMKGILPENAAADFDFASAIEEAAKKLKEAEGKYSTLTGRDPKAEEKAANERAKAEEKAAAELAEVRARIEDEEYELKKAGTTDRIKLLELEKQHALEALREEMAAAKLVYEALGKDTSALEAAYARLSELTGKRYDIEISNERDEQNNNAAAELQSLLSQYQDYTAKRKAIEEQYNEDIRKLQEARTDENAAEIDAAIAEAKRQLQDSVAQLELDNLYDSSQWVNFFDNIESLSKNTATELYQILHEQLQALLDANKISIDDYVRVLTEMSEQLRSKLSNTGYFGSYQSGGIDSLLGDVFKTGKSIGGAKGMDMMNFASKAQGAVAMVDMIIKAVYQTIQAIKGISDEVNDMMASFGEDVDIETSRGKWTEFANLFSEFNEHVYSGWENLKSGNIAGAIQETVASITSLIANINRWKDKLKEARIEDLELQIESLGDAYDDLQKKADKAYSTVRARMITQSNDNLQRQIELIDEKIKEEESKKDTDNERIESWRDEQDQLREEIEANAEAAQEAINGISFDSFRNEFLDLMMDFESGSEDFADSFNEHLQRAIYDSLLAEKYQSAIRELYDKFSEYGEDGITEEEAEKLRGMYSDLTEDLIEERDKINDAFGFDDFDREGSSKGIAQASQESIDYLNGLMTNVNDNVFSMSEHVKALATMNSGMHRILESIESNTRPIADIRELVEDMYAEVHATRKAVDDQGTRGVKIR